LTNEKRRRRRRRRRRKNNTTEFLDNKISQAHIHMDVCR
jgi:hypothetical protein